VKLAFDRNQARNEQTIHNNLVFIGF